MADVAWLSFLAVTALAFGLFFISRRRVDFLTIAYIGALFYFSPLLWGKVLQLSRNLTRTIQPEVYLIATAYILALVVAGIISERLHRKLEPSQQPTRPLAGWYLMLALIGLATAIITTKGAIFNADKVVALEQFGYFYIAFEMAASLACISAVIERRWWFVAASCLLLMVDLLVGIRAFVVLTALSVPLVLLMRDGRIRLFTKAPSYGVAALLLVLSMLMVHTARFVIFDRLAVAQHTKRPDIAKSSVPNTMWTDILQSDQSAIQKWAMVPFKLLEQSEPFIVQATLVGVVQTNLSCSPSNILKSLYLLAPPGFSGLLPNAFPPTFFDEYQPILYPDLLYGGLGGNIWAEMLCRFGYIGVAIFGVLMIASLVWLSRLLRTASPTLQAPIAFGGVIVAFYINRNDLHYTLVMLRQMAIVFAAAWILSWLRDRLLNFTRTSRSRS